jgi:hypothetical protein
MKRTASWAALIAALCILAAAITIPVTGSVLPGKSVSAVSSATTIIALDDDGSCSSSGCQGSFQGCSCPPTVNCPEGYCEICHYDVGGGFGCTNSGCCACNGGGLEG